MTSLRQRAIDEALRLLCASFPPAPAEGQADKGEADGGGQGRRGNAAQDPASSSFASLVALEKRDPLVDSALAVMGFSRTTVRDAVNNTLLRTLIGLLRSSIASSSFSIAHHVEAALLGEVQSNNIYYAGYSPNTVCQIVDYSIHFLEAICVEENVALELVEVLVEVISMVSSLKCSIFRSCIFYDREKEIKQMNITTIIRVIVKFAQERKQLLYNRFSPHTRSLCAWTEPQRLLFAGHRLLLWRLQPEILSQDLSTLLQKVMDRPLLVLKEELRHVQEWRNFVIALAFAPDAFDEARSTLNAWFLALGSPCVWELKVELGASLRDLLESPCSWGLLEQVGLNLPPLSTFYHNCFSYLVKILMNPPSLFGLCELVLICEKDCEDGKSCEIKGYVANSLWFLLMDFPSWVQYACFILFTSLRDNVTSNAHEMTRSGESNPQMVAAKYIAWLCNPFDQEFRRLVIRTLVEIVRSWQCIESKEGMGSKGTKESSENKRRKLLAGYSYGACKNNTDDGMNGCERVTEEITQWLTNLASSLFFLSSSKHWGVESFDVHGSENTAKTMRRPLMYGKVLLVENGHANNAPAHEESSTAGLGQFTFLDTLPLVALTISPQLHTPMSLHLITHFTLSLHDLSLQGNMSCKSSSFDISKFQELAINIKGPFHREPAHRTEDFKDILCSFHLCSDPLFHRAWIWGMATIFVFLEGLDFLQDSDLSEYCSGFVSLDRFKDLIAQQLVACIHSWSQQAGSQHVVLLDDLRRRASSWAAIAGLEARTMKMLNQVLQSLDIIIALSLAEDT